MLLLLHGAYGGVDLHAGQFHGTVVPRRRATEAPPVNLQLSGLVWSSVRMAFEASIRDWLMCISCYVLKVLDFTEGAVEVSPQQPSWPRHIHNIVLDGNGWQALSKPAG